MSQRKKNRGIPQHLRKAILVRDKYTCRKCDLQDQTGNILDVHHILPRICSGDDFEENLITLCRDCHYYAPNNKADFEEYVQEKMEGSSTMLLLAFKKFRERYNDEEWKLLEEKAKKEKKI